MVQHYSDPAKPRGVAGVADIPPLVSLPVDRLPALRADGCRMASSECAGAPEIATPERFERRIIEAAPSTNPDADTPGTPYIDYLFRPGTW